MESVRGVHSIQVRWKPFELNPGLPPGGMPRQQYRLRKFGDPRRIEEMDRRLTVVGAEEGIAFALHRIERTPNTLDAHRLVWFSQQRNLQDRVVEGLFRAFFTEGRDIGDRIVLAAIGAEAGIEPASVAAFLEGPEGVQEVRAEERKASELGVDSVPFFIIGGKYSVLGAQPAGVFLEAFEQLSQSPPRPL